MVTTVIDDANDDANDDSNYKYEKGRGRERVSWKLITQL
jgi:hypothetical protein